MSIAHNETEGAVVLLPFHLSVNIFIIISTKQLDLLKCMCKVLVFVRVKFQYMSAWIFSHKMLSQPYEFIYSFLHNHFELANQSVVS